MGTNQKLKNLFVIYGSYHHNIVNKICHMICVPLILVTLFQLYRYLSQSILPVNPYILPTVLITLGLLHYIFNIDVPVGILASIVYPAFCYLQIYLTRNMNVSDHFKLILVIQIVGWVAQFITHGFFEKRKPALLDDVGQILSAPLFVLTEFLFLFGWKKQSRPIWEKQIEQKIKKLQNVQKTN